MVRVRTGLGLVQVPGHELDRGMNLGEGRNLSMGQDGDGAGGLSRVEGSAGAVDLRQRSV